VGFGALRVREDAMTVNPAYNLSYVLRGVDSARRAIDALLARPLKIRNVRESGKIVAIEMDTHYLSSVSGGHK
jgi:hypothetical protein